MLQYRSYAYFGTIDETTITSETIVLITDVISGKRLEGYPEDLRKKAGITCYETVIFDSKDAIDNRIDAFNQCVAWVDHARGKFSDPREVSQYVQSIGLDELLEQVGGRLKVFNAWVTVLLDGQELEVGNIMGAGHDMISAWQQEYAAYEKGGFDIGAPEPFVAQYEPLGGTIHLLPQLEPCWPVTA